MLDLYISNKNALISLEQSLKIAISNANNYNTPGHKYTTTSFTTMYTETISTGTDRTNPMVKGHGMMLGATKTDFSQGSIGQGTNLDLAIVGEGFFILSGSAAEFSGNSKKLYTRSGRFQVDGANNHLIDSYGRKLFGFKTDAEGNVISQTLEPVTTKGFADIAFEDGGTLVANPSSDNPVSLFKVALTSFQNKQGLVYSTGGAFEATLSAGEEFSPNIAGASIVSQENSVSSGSAYGDMVAQALESSNIEIPKVALDMSLLNRGFTAVQAVIDDVTKILSDIIKKLGG